MPAEHFLQQCRHHLPLKDLWLLLLFSEDSSEKVSRRDLVARFLKISGDQTPACCSWYTTGALGVLHHLAVQILARRDPE